MGVCSVCGPTKVSVYSHKPPYAPKRRCQNQNIHIKRITGSRARARKEGYEPVQIPPNFSTHEQMEKQDKKCALCETRFPEISKALWDHCHTTGAFRGLLCVRCNTSLGYFKEDIEWMKRAVSYLASPPGVL